LYPASTSWVSAYGPSVTTGTPSLSPCTRRVCTGAVNPCASTNSPDSTSDSFHLPMNSDMACGSSGDQAGEPGLALPAIAS
jgi:hypothetical protein